MNNKIYGYDCVDGKLVINEIESEVIKWIFSTVATYIKHPPKVLVDAVISNHKELYGEELSYEVAEKKVSYSSILEYLSEEVNDKHLLFNLSDTKAISDLKNIFALSFDEVKERLSHINVPNEQISFWKDFIANVAQNPIYMGTTDIDASANCTHEPIVAPSIFNEVQKKRICNNSSIN